MVKEDLIEEVIEVAMVFGRKILHVFSVYAPQQGRSDEEKRKILEKL